MRCKLTALTLGGLLLASCLGTTGNSLVQFRAAVSGPSDAKTGEPLTFTSGLGFHVMLTKAMLHVGALYLVQTLPVSGGGPSPCVLEGTYVAEAITPVNPIPAGIDVDLLSPNPQYFPKVATGTNLQARAGQVWLTGAQVDEINDRTPILILHGTAIKAGTAYPFSANITIGRNRLVQPTDSSKPGTDPICKQRIVSPVLVNIQPNDGGTLLLRVDPRLLFVDVDFSQLHKPSGDQSHYAFADSSEDEPSSILYSTLHNTGALYQFQWTPGSLQSSL